MLTLDYDTIRKACIRTPNEANTYSFITAFNAFGSRFGVDQPHRLAQLLPQVLHESAEFRYDGEIWGPTPAQKRYDTRTDLGNTPERDGDGFKYRGRAGIQITGADNYKAFTRWCRKNIGPNSPDFFANPDLVNTDPWEGLAVFWYWSTRDLNRYADQGDNEMITRKINGGLNGYDDRLRYYTRVGLVLLGFSATGITAFQQAAKKEGVYTGKVDGLDGPRTRSAIHKMLLALTSRSELTEDVKAGPVVEVVPPPQIDKPVTETTGFWERIGQIGGLSGIAGMATFFQDWRVILAMCAALIVLALVGLLLHKRLIDAARSVKTALN